MTIHLLQIPSEPADEATWLEGYFSGDRLGELVHELKLVQNSASSRRRLIAVFVATAAAVLGVMFWPSPHYAGSGQIFGQASLVKNDVDSSSAYRNRLADAGATWFDHRPESKEELAIVLSEVRRDCQLLIDAPHEALSASKREWFVTKCKNWKDKFDEAMASLDADTISLTDAQSAADAIMTKLVNVVRAGPTA